MAAIERDTMLFDKVIGEHDELEYLSIYRGDRGQARPKVRAVLSLVCC